MANDLRARTLACLDGGEVFPVPTDLYLNMIYPPLEAQLMRHYAVGETDHEGLRVALGAHIRYGMPIYIGPEPETTTELGPAVFPAAQVMKNIWGAWDGVETLSDSYPRPLREAQSVSDIHAHRWPEPDWYDYSRLGWKGDTAEQVLPVAGWARRHASFARTVHAWMPVFTNIMDLFGMEVGLVNLATRPDLIEATVGHIEEFLLEYYERLAASVEGHADVFGFSDDFAGQAGLLMNPNKWRKMFLPMWQRFFAIAHKHNMKTQMHSCGSVRAVLGDLVDAGLDVLENVQIRAVGMDPVELKREFGSHLTFYGAVDEQILLPTGTPEEVHAEVRRLVDILGRNGRYILTSSHFLQGDIPAENVIAMYDEARVYVPAA